MSKKLTNVTNVKETEGEYFIEVTKFFTQDGKRKKFVFQIPKWSDFKKGDSSNVALINHWCNQFFNTYKTAKILDEKKAQEIITQYIGADGYAILQDSFNHLNRTSEQNISLHLDSILR
jgi:hypothetical protein